MSVHAVHAVTERNVCYIVVSTETPQTTTNPSQMLLPVYKLTPAPLKVLTQDPHSIYLSLLFKCATDVSIRSRPPA